MTEIVNKNKGISTHNNSVDDVQNTFPRQPDLAGLRNMRILLVDDLPTNIILAQAILEHGGFSNVITAESGDKALKMLEQHSRSGKCDIDVVLLDIILPGKNGYSVCRSMRQHPAWNHIPVIMITSDTKWKEETALAAFENGATDILFKPVRSVELIPRVIAALSLKTERDSRLSNEQVFRQKINEHTLLEARLKYLTSHDDLTGLLNRRRLEQLLELATVYARNYERQSALLYIDLEDFSQFTDSQGYDAGDRLLVEFATQLKHFAGGKHHAARTGTSDFALLVDDCDNDFAMSIARSLHTTVEEMTFTASNQYSPSIRIGIAVISRDEQISTSEIIGRANQACHTARLNDHVPAFIFSSKS